MPNLHKDIADKIYGLYIINLEAKTTRAMTDKILGFNDILIFEHESSTVIKFTNRKLKYINLKFIEIINDMVLDRIMEDYPATTDKDLEYHCSSVFIYTVFYLAFI